MLEVDVDVGRLVALLADEALEQHRHARRIDFGDAERVADGRVGRRSAALAEDVLRPRESDDVLDGEEIGLVAKLGDQRQLVLDQLADVGGHMRTAEHRVAAQWRVVWGISSREPLLGQFAQMRRGRLARGDDFLGILVAEFVQRKRAALRDRERLREQRRWIDRRQARARPQMPLTIGKERVTALGEGLFHADRGNRVLQRAPGARVHMDIASRDLRQPACLRERSTADEPRAVEGAGEELDGDPSTVRKRCGDPACRRVRGQARFFALTFILVSGNRAWPLYVPYVWWDPQGEQPIGERGDIGAR